MKKVFLTVLAVATSVCMSAVEVHYGLELGYDGSYMHEFSKLGEKINSDRSGVANGFHVGPNVQIDFLSGKKHIPSLIIGLNYQFLGKDWIASDKERKEKVEAYKEGMKKLGAENITVRYYESLHTLQIPIYAQYTYQFREDMNIHVFTGPTIKFHVSDRVDDVATYTIDGKKYGLEVHTDNIIGKYAKTEWLAGAIKDEQKGKYEGEDRDYLEPCLDMAWNLGFGYSWKNLSINISYGLGMLNQFSENERELNRVIAEEARKQNTDYLHTRTYNNFAVTLGYRFK